MKINLGTTSERKIQIVQKALADNGSFQLKPCDVNSEITDQPIDLETTITGAKNRARNAFNSDKDSKDAGLGLEAGLVKLEGLFHLVCVCAIYNEGKYFIGVSNLVPLPTKVSELVDSGGEFGVVVREYQSEHIDDKGINPLLERLISRSHDFTEAINIAWIKYSNKVHF